MIKRQFRGNWQLSDGESEMYSNFLKCLKYVANANQKYLNENKMWDKQKNVTQSIT